MKDFFEIGAHYEARLNYKTVTLTKLSPRVKWCQDRFGNDIKSIWFSDLFVRQNLIWVTDFYNNYYQFERVMEEHQNVFRLVRIELISTREQTETSDYFMKQINFKKGDNNGT